MKNNPLVSVIVTTYNQKDFIADTIQSLINQEYKNIEILVWDDSPNEETWNIIQKFCKKYPKKICARHHSLNKWIIWNMEFLISKISKDSKYTAFLEWDDMYTKDNINDKIKIFQEFNDVKLVYNNLTIIDKAWNIIKQSVLNWKFYQNEKITKKDINEIELKEIPVYSSWSSLMVDNEVLHYLNSGNYLWRNNEISDIFFFYTIAMNHNIYGLEKPLTLYRRHWNNISIRINGTMIFDKIKLIEYRYKWRILEKKTYDNVICRLNTNYAMAFFYKWFKVFKEAFKISRIKTIKNFFHILFKFIKQ